MGFENTTGTGSLAHYGPRDANQKFGGLNTDGAGTNKAVYVFDYDDLPAGGASDNNYATIPANAFIQSAKIYVETAMDGTSGTLTVGLEEQDGTDIDADGIDATVAQAALTANAVIVCDGALVGASIGTAAGQLLVTTGGTVTAGKFKVVIEYMVL